MKVTTTKKKTKTEKIEQLKREKMELCCMNPLFEDEQTKMIKSSFSVILPVSR